MTKVPVSSFFVAVAQGDTNWHIHSRDKAENKLALRRGGGPGEPASGTVNRVGPGARVIAEADRDAGIGRMGHFSLGRLIEAVGPRYKPGIGGLGTRRIPAPEDDEIGGRSHSKSRDHGIF